MRFATEVVLLALVLPASAGAVTIDSLNPVYQRWADEARVPTVPGMIVVSEETAPEAPNASSTPGVISIDPALATRLMFLHELGHQFDYFEMNDSARAAFQKIAGLIGPWRNSAFLHFSPHEVFAETYAFCALKPRMPHSGIIHQQEPPLGHKTRYNQACKLITRG